MSRVDIPINGKFTMAKQIIPGEIVCSPGSSTIIAHFQVQVTVSNQQHQIVTTRTKENQIQVMLNGFNPQSDVEKIANSIIGSSPVFPQTQREKLITALKEMKTSIGRPLSTQPRSLSFDDDPRKIATAPAPRSESTPLFPPTPAQLDDLLHQAPYNIHLGSEQECAQTLQKLVEAAQTPKVLARILENEPLVNTLMTTLRRYVTTSIPICMRIMILFERMSYYTNFHDALGKFKIGSNTLSFLHAQLHIIKMFTSPDAGKTQTTKEEITNFTKRQNQLLRYVVSCLLNLAENPVNLRKMVNKGAIDPLIPLLRRKDPDIVTNSLIFLRRISSNATNWGEVPFDEIIPTIARDVFRWKPTAPDKRQRFITVLQEGLELLYIFALHIDETIDSFRDAGIFEGLTNLSDVPELSGQLIRLFYQFSTIEQSFQSFRNPQLLNAVITKLTGGGQERIAASIILSRICQDKEIAQIVSSSSHFNASHLKDMIVEVIQDPSQEHRANMSIIKSIAESQPQLIQGFDNELIEAISKNLTDYELLPDLYGIMNRVKMSSDRAKTWVASAPLTTAIMTTLGSRAAPPQALLECVMLVSTVVLYSQCAKTLHKLNIVDALVKIFMSYADDVEIQTQCLFAFYRIVCHTDTRNALVRHSEIIGTVIKHAADKNQVLNSIANNVLDVLTTFDQTWAERIKEPRFAAFNADWLREAHL